jgi:diaminohydroxyphosphoribosylaminopyrimidine deaminase/5-amino-6-(5-phosphoribosylamino)uracil reductase
VESNDEFWMRRALAEAERGRGAVEPNPLVGAAVVSNGGLVGVGYHARFGGPHAEIAALDAAGAAARGATLYVTLEPCCHQGKTPPCTEAIKSAGIHRVVAAMTDPFPRVAGGGFAQLRSAGLEVESGLLETDARRLNAPYLKLLATGRPYVIAKWAMSLDGKTATASGDSRWISGPRARTLVHEQRGRMDAIVVGIGTALADDPLLTSRFPGPRRAARVVLDSAARLPVDCQLVRTAGDAPVWVAVTERAGRQERAALAARGCDILALPGSGQVPVVPLLEELGRRGLTNVLLEGGGTVLGSFLDAGQVDAVDVYIAPILTGGAAARTPAGGLGCARIAAAWRLDRYELSMIDGDLRLQATVLHPQAPAQCP